MESEKVKEIKKALECCKQNEIENTCEYCSNCPASDWDYETECNVELFQKILTLINELEKEIEENAFYSKGYAQGIKNTYEVVVPNKLKQFATLLKVKTVLTPSGWCVNIEDIDEILKKFIKE